MLITSRLRMVQAGECTDFQEIQWDTRAMENRLVFDLPVEKRLDVLIFEPVSDWCVAKVKEIVIYPADSSPYTLTGFTSNAVDPAAVELMFATKKPVVRILLFGQRVRQVAIGLCVFHAGEAAMDAILRRFFDNMDAGFHRMDTSCRRREDRFQNDLYRAGEGIDRIRRQMRKKALPGYRLDQWKKVAKDLLATLGIHDTDLRLIRESFLFDTSYYHYQLGADAQKVKNPQRDYLENGTRTGYQPHPLFDTFFYLEKNPDVAESGVNPLVHFIRSGAAEGRAPNPFFDVVFYRKTNPETAAPGQNPLIHYITKGAQAGKSPNRHVAQLRENPLVSLVMPVFNTPEVYLRRSIESVLYQTYPHLELCIADDASTLSHIRPMLEAYGKKDGRVKTCFLEVNSGIAAASNAAAGMAGGEFIGFIDHDDELTPDALYEVVRALQEEGTDIVYTDEAVVDASGKAMSFICKPGYSPDLLLSHNYITHLCLVRRALFEGVGGFSGEFEGAQDYDLMLRLSEVTRRILHVPKVLYLWRAIESSTSADPEAKSYADEAGLKALRTALARRGIDGEVQTTSKRFFYRVKRALVRRPLVSIVIAFKDQATYLARCIDAILKHTRYLEWEIVGIDNQSEKEETRKLMARLDGREGRIRFHSFPQPFNYSELMNFGATLCRGEHILMMNSDVEVLENGWLEALLEHSQRPEVGAVGAKLLYPDGTIQHGGVIVGIKGFAGHAHRFFPGEAEGYYNRLQTTQNLSAVTGALMMVKRSAFMEVGGFDAENLPIALNDVDFCLKLATRGRINVWTPYCQAVHHESVSRGDERSPEKRARFEREIRFFRRKWKDFIKKGDPCYNRQLTLSREDFSLSQVSYRLFKTMNRIRSLPLESGR